MRRLASPSPAACALLTLLSILPALAQWQEFKQDPCLLQVVAANGRPIAGAIVGNVYMDRLNLWTTDRQGRACGEIDLTRGTITVTAPPERGGRCAGVTQFVHSGWEHFSRPPLPLRRVTLDMIQLPRQRWLARVVSSDGRPIRGATIRVETVEPKRTECSDRGPFESFETGKDGRLLLPLFPEGLLTLRVKHTRFAERTFNVDTTAPRRDLQLERGARWTGRLLDPEGIPIERCEIRLSLANQMSVKGVCMPTGFDIQAIPPGHAEVYVEITGPHSGLERHRIHKMHVEFASNEQRVDDIRWPVGLPIGGQVVTEEGHPVPSANIAVLSQGREVSSAQGRIELVADANGRFVIQHLVPGSWTISSGGRSVVVNAGATNVRIVVSRQH